MYLQNWSFIKILEGGVRSFYLSFLIQLCVKATTGALILKARVGWTWTWTSKEKVGLFKTPGFGKPAPILVRPFVVFNKTCLSV